MAAITSAVQPAVSSAVNPADSVNNAVWSPAAEKYPGSIDPTQYTDTNPYHGVEGPVPGGGDNPFGAAHTAPHAGSGGGIVDLSFTTGTDATQAVWDSNGGTSVLPNLSYPGATLPELHDDDGTGSVAANQFIVPAAIGKLTRRTPAGQTYTRDYVYDPVNGGLIPSVNGRIDYDQYQDWNPAPLDDGPWWTPYSERPVLNNIAYQATPVNTVSNQYGVNGILPDRSQFSYGASAYLAPPDVVVDQPAAPAPSASSSGWLLG